MSETGALDTSGSVSTPDTYDGKALLVLDSVSKAYGGLKVLSSVSFTVRLGERVGLIGPNGAGKTTLFNCISGNEHPDTGRIVFADHSILTKSVAQRALLGIGRTFQHIQLFSDLDVEGNLLVSIRSRKQAWSIGRDLLNRAKLTASEDEMIAQTLSILKIDDLRHSFPASLTLGQGRLVEVARALVSGPSLLLLDEPASGLDISESEDLAKALTDANEAAGVTLLIVEHDLITVGKIAERIILLEEGCLVADGPTEEVLTIARASASYSGKSVPNPASANSANGREGNSGNVRRNPADANDANGTSANGGDSGGGGGGDR